MFSVKMKCCVLPVFTECSTLIPRLPTGRSGIRIPAGSEIFFLHQTSRVALGPTWPLFRRKRGLSLGAKRPRLEADHSFSSSAEDKNERSCIPFLPYILWRLGADCREMFISDAP